MVSGTWDGEWEGEDSEWYINGGQYVGDGW